MFEIGLRDVGDVHTAVFQRLLRTHQHFWCFPSLSPGILTLGLHREGRCQSGTGTGVCRRVGPGVVLCSAAAAPFCNTFWEPPALSWLNGRSLNVGASTGGVLFTR